MQYFDEARNIWKEFAPRSGQATTVQGELLRAVEKLRDEALRNGNGNWDDGFEILLAYLFARLLDPNAFPSQVIAETRETLERMKNFEEPLLDDDAYDELGDRVVEYFLHYGSMPHEQNPALKR